MNYLSLHPSFVLLPIVNRMWICKYHSNFQALQYSNSKNTHVIKLYAKIMQTICKKYSENMETTYYVHHIHESYNIYMNVLQFCCYCKWHCMKFTQLSSNLFCFFRYFKRCVESVYRIWGTYNFQSKYKFSLWIFFLFVPKYNQKSIQ